VVLEYATPNSQKDLGWLFRTSESDESMFRFRPRGLDMTKTYDVTFSNSGQTIQLPDCRLSQEGIPVRVGEDLTSELLIFGAK
jgi:hypothetical protein